MPTLKIVKGGKSILNLHPMEEEEKGSPSAREPGPTSLELIEDKQLELHAANYPANNGEGGAYVTSLLPEHTLVNAILTLASLGLSLDPKDLDKFAASSIRTNIRKCSKQCSARLC